MSHTVDDDPPIKTHPASKEYRDGWERIFGEDKDEPESGDVVESVATRLFSAPPDEPCDVCEVPAGEWCKPGCSEQ